MQEKDIKKLIRNIQKIKAEDNKIELKSAKGGAPKIYDTLSSFSNQDGGGIILLGIDENSEYEVVGVKDVKQIVENVEKQCAEMEPKVEAIIEAVSIKDKVVVCVEVPGVDVFRRPVYYKGIGMMKGSYIRIGNRDEKMTAYDVYSYEAYKRRIKDDKREVDNVDESLIDNKKLKSYLNKIKENKKNLAKLSDDKILTLSGIKNNGKWTLASVMLFSVYPQAYFKQFSIIATAISGLEKGEEVSGERFIDNKRIDGTIEEMIDDAIKFVKKNMRTSIAFDEDGKRIDRDEYPMIAIREAIINTLVHRDYSIHTEGIPISIEMYSNRIEIKNPGGIYGNVPVENLGKENINTRNEVVANAMEIMGLTENRYSGIPTIRSELKKAGLSEPEFKVENGSFKVVFYNTMRNNIVDKNNLINKIKGNEFEDMILEFCEEPKTRQEIVDYTHLSYYYTINVLLKKLIDDGKIGMTIPDKPKSSKQKYFACEY